MSLLTRYNKAIPRLTINMWYGVDKGHENIGKDVDPSL